MFYAYMSPFLVYFALLSFLVASIIQAYTLLNHARVASANSGVSYRQVRMVIVEASCHGRLFHGHCASTLLLVSALNAELGLLENVRQAQHVGNVLGMQGPTLAAANGAVAKHFRKLASTISSRITGKRSPLPEHRESWKEWLLGEAARSIRNVRQCDWATSLQDQLQHDCKKHCMPRRDPGVYWLRI
jgi:hypothetical protein